ncbi:protein O-linked-mannose beta-1,2-N-acetylglucosaminyltransferase 1-like [Cherax quadricarinatus]|uniref:protein O-linked-mannose beta-1,2-N-acetylglucosaminyltransferase 1-like n=1 Tax=Cherax quadricarinatus TaxID=27406 RepID=UPI00387E4951
MYTHREYVEVQRVEVTGVTPQVTEAGLTNATNVGLFISIIHQSTGRMMGGYQHLQPWADLRRLIALLNSIQPGRIIVFMLRSDLEYGLPEEVRRFLRREGSAGAANLVGRGAFWAWVWVKGGPTLAEALSLPTRQAMAHGILLHTVVLLIPNTEYCPGWPTGEHWRLRRHFCDSYEQYGELCSCLRPYNITSSIHKVVNNQIERAAIIVIAHRVPALYKSLKTVMSAAGFSSGRVEVFTPEPQQELEEFVQVFDLPLTITHQESYYVATLISKQFIFAIKHVLNKYSDAEFVIVLEEDISVSPDFFVFLNRSAVILREDPSLLCASAHNDLSYPGTSHDPRVALRAHSYTNYGWMVTREVAKELASGMPGTELEYDWDVYIYFYLSRGRECIIPEVSRSHHFGDSGSHISQFTQRLYFTDKNYNLDPSALVENIDNLREEEYEEYLTSLLAGARFINSTHLNPCHHSFYTLFTVRDHDVLVMFFHVEGDINYYRTNNEWTTLAWCLGTFALESRESHRGLYRLRYGAAHLLLVAYPASPYSQYKPAEVGVFVATRELQEAAYRKGDGRLKKDPYNLQSLQQRYLNLVTV